MSRAEVGPSVATGAVRAPPSKSYTHRALLAGHFTHGTYRVADPLDSEDTRATLSGLSAFGTRSIRRRASWRLAPGTIPAHPTVRCGASGTTLRLLSAVAALSSSPTRFTGTNRLGQRPMESLLNVMRSHGATVRHPPHAGLPLVLSGPLQAGRYEISGGESSQFLSALLFALPGLPDDSTVVATGPVVSAPYIAATQAVLRAHRIRVSGPMGRWNVPGGQRYRGRQFDVPGDASSAAYLWAAGALSGGAVTVRGIPAEWPQADLAILSILRSTGCHIRRASSSITVEGIPSRPFEAELTPCPDLYPLVGAIAARIPGISQLRGAPHIVGKESDRRAATIDLVRRLGGRATIRPGRLEVKGAARPTPVRGGSWEDHRLVMSAAVGSLGLGGTARFGDPTAVRKSYPKFWSDLGSLGVDARIRP